MTRLTAADISAVVSGLPALDRRLRRGTGFDLASLAYMTAVGPGPVADQEVMAGVEVCVVPVTSGKGTIDGFAEAVAGICAYLGCRSRVSSETDVAGLATAVERGSEIVLMADDGRFIALNLLTGGCVDNGLATGHVYAMTLNAAANGLANRPVLVLGVGPVGLAACASLRRLGARVRAFDPDPARSEVAERFFQVEPVASVEDGLAAVQLVVDASPVAGLIPGSWAAPHNVVVAPGLPNGATEEAARILGERLIHEPLAMGVAAMIAQSCLGSWTDTTGRPVRRPRSSLKPTARSS